MARGQVRPAIRHWLQTSHLDQVLRLIEHHAGEFLDRQEYETLRGWLDALPPTMITGHPLLAVMHAGLLALTGDLQHVPRIQQEIEAARGHLPGGGVQDALHALSAQLQDNTYTALDLLTSTDAPPPLAVRLLLTYAYTVWLDGDLRQAEAQLRQAVDAARLLGDKQSLAIASVQLGQLFMLQGRLRQAEASFYAAIYQGKGHAPALVAALAHVGLADVYREWNQLDLAAAHARRCLHLPTLPGDVRATALLAFSAILTAKRDWEGAAGALRAAESAAQLIAQPATPATPVLAHAITARRLILSVKTGDLALVWRWLYRCGLTVSDPIAPAQWPEYRLLAWTLIHVGKFAEALELTSRLVDLCTALGWSYRKVESLALSAVAFEGDGQTAYALPTLAEAVTLAEPGELLRAFVDALASVDDAREHPLLRLLRTMRGQRSRQAGTWGAISDLYLSRLLAAFDPAPPRPRPALPTPNALIEPLSARESEIMRLLALGYSNQKIAARLLIAESTVKRHINNIYGKLQVNSRTQALRRAEELGLLS
jgi:LuxR family maltose regulon positive regulatory protein